MNDNDDRLSPETRLVMEAVRIAGSRIPEPPRAAAALAFASMLLMEATLGRAGALAMFGEFVKPQLEAWTKRAS